METATLRKILELERQKDYRDIAVVGGLDRLLKRGVDGLPARLGDISYVDMDAHFRELTRSIRRALPTVKASRCRDAARQATRICNNRNSFTPADRSSLSKQRRLIALAATDRLLAA